MKHIVYQAGYKYQLQAPFAMQTGILPVRAGGNQFVAIDGTGNLFISAGYAWDGASGPAIDTPSFMRGSLVHDAFYQLIRLGNVALEDRDKADRLLQTLCLEDGMLTFRAWYVYHAVRLFGGDFLAHPESPIITAP